MVDRVYQRNATETAPQPPADPSEGYPTDGNPAQSIPATAPGAYWFHMITESLRRVVVEAGLTPNHEDLGQLIEALQNMGLGGYASEADAQALSSLTKILTPGRLNDAFKGDNQLLAESGYQDLPGGLIIQWSSTAQATVSGSNLLFPIAFPNQAFAIAAMDFGIEGSRYIQSYNNLANTGFTVFGGGSTDLFSYIALGH